MIDDRLPLAELMEKTGDGDFLSSAAESVLRIIMTAGVDGLIGAGRHKRTGERSKWRNGYRNRSLDTRLGTFNLMIPKLRPGAYATLRDPAAIGAAAAEPVPNRHAAVYGYVSYAAANTSFNAIASAEYLLLAVSAIKSVAGEYGGAPMA